MPFIIGYFKLSGKALIMCQSSKKEFFKKFLYEPLPVEVSCFRFALNSTNIELNQKLC